MREAQLKVQFDEALNQRIIASGSELAKQIIQLDVDMSVDNSTTLKLDDSRMGTRKNPLIFGRFPNVIKNEESDDEDRNASEKQSLLYHI